MDILFNSRVFILNVNIFLICEEVFELTILSKKILEHFMNLLTSSRIQEHFFIWIVF